MGKNLSKAPKDIDLEDEESLFEDLEELPPKVLRKMIRRLKARRLSDRDEEEEEEILAKHEKDRKELAELHEEGHGAPPEVPVEDEDLPESLSGDEEEEEDEEKDPPKFFKKKGSSK